MSRQNLGKLSVTFLLLGWGAFCCKNFDYNYGQINLLFAVSILLGVVRLFTSDVEQEEKIEEKEE